MLDTVGALVLDCREPKTLLGYILATGVHWKWVGRIWALDRQVYGREFLRYG